MTDPALLKLILTALGLTVVLAPTLLMAVLAIASVLGTPLAERGIGRCVHVAVVTGLLAALAMLGIMLTLLPNDGAINSHHVPINLGSWVDVRDHDDFEVYNFEVKFIFDRLSVPFVILTYVLCGTIGAFANRYMHRERGFNRFFVFYAMFMMGMVITSVSGTIETLFAGWELVGLSSAMLVAFFHDRPAPVSNGLRVWVVYRISDAALLIAAVAIHLFTGSGDFDKFLGPGYWPPAREAVASVEPAADAALEKGDHAKFHGGVEKELTPNHALMVGLLLLLAAAGKSALVPFSGWLPRAMEGPTPSSAIFYGALSVHLGAFLLLRFSHVLNQSPVLCAAVVTAGLLTAAFASLTQRVQTDIKSALSFASLTQVGIIVAEIGLGFRYIALIHILGHGCLRTLQFLRAPTLLLDYHVMENAIGDHLPRSKGIWTALVPSFSRIWIYRLALERGYLDSYLSDYLVYPFLRVLRFCDYLERRWTDLLSGGASRESENVGSTSGTIEELL